MSSSPPPTKPPRGVKQGKETSGLLMSVIRTLSASETNEQREKERAKLEKEYKKSDAKLDELVAQNAAEIMEVMQKFSQAQAALSAWGQRSDAATARLGACRQLLRLRRDDLRRLWTDARASAHALEMLTDIELVASSEHSFSSAASSGLVLSAAHTLRGALAAAASLHAPALHAAELRLQMKKQELVDTIVSGLNAAVYRGQPALSRRPSARRRAALLIAELTKPEEVTDAYLQDITPEFEASLTEEDKTFETTVMISLEALGVLDSLKEASEKFKVQIQGQLLEVIDTVSRRIIAEGDTDIEGDECERDGDIQTNDGATESDRPLTRLVQCLSDEFRANALRNNRLLQLWRAALQRHKMSDSCLHTEQHYWSAVQQVMQLLLTEYLDISWLAVKGRSAAPPPDLRLPDYFAKKRVPRKPARLFTLPPVTSTTQPSARRLARAPLVASPGAARLPAVLPPLHELASLAARPVTSHCRPSCRRCTSWPRSRRAREYMQRDVTLPAVLPPLHELASLAARP
ncbi:unnamed protein product [Plutella xylostella]|uniref:Exocyst complex component Sec8 n=1 Tax=Plutella xylostella TaxID=51655 RepID=A0A8S4FII5_PLUXY|nr:unnamed protein product [Plutella xylostella]